MGVIPAEFPLVMLSIREVLIPPLAMLAVILPKSVIALIG
jgi:hypothetical protein